MEEDVQITPTGRSRLPSLPELGSSGGFFLLNGSFSVLLKPKSLLKGIIWLSGFTLLYYFRLFLTLQYKVPWSNSCCDLRLYKYNWTELKWIELLDWCLNTLKLATLLCLLKLYEIKNIFFLWQTVVFDIIFKELVIIIYAQTGQVTKNCDHLSFESEKWTW